MHGTIILQDTLPVAEFNITKPSKRKYREKRIFLFEQIVIVSDICERAMTGLYYKYRSSIKVKTKILPDNTYWVFV